MQRNTFEGEEKGKGVSRNSLERDTRDGESPVDENPFTLLAIFLEYHEARTLWEIGRANLPRLNTPRSPIANQYREGKVKSTPVRGVK